MQCNATNHLLNYSPSHTHRIHTHVHRSKAKYYNTNSESRKGRASIHILHTYLLSFPSFFPSSSLGSLHPQRTEKSLAHRNPHLDIMALVAMLIVVASPIVRVSRGTIGEIIQVQLPVHRRFHVAISSVLWRWVDAAKVAAGRR